MSSYKLQYILSIFLTTDVIYGATSYASLNQVQALEKTVDNLQKQIQLQEQANARVLADVLSQLATTTSRLKEVTANNTALETELEAVKQTYKIKETAQEAELVALKGNLTYMSKQIDVLTPAVMNLQSYQQAQSVHEQNQDGILTSTQLAVNNTLVDLQAKVSSLEVLLDTMNSSCEVHLQEQEQLYAQIRVQLNDTDSRVSTLNNKHSLLTAELDGLSSNCSFIESEVGLVFQHGTLLEHDLSNLTTDFEVLERQLSILKNEMLLNSRLNSSIFELEGVINALESNVTSSLYTLNTEISTLQKAANTAFKDKNSTNVSFETSTSVSLAGRKDYGTDETIVFSQPLSNEGGGYDKAKGSFTAPVSGTYLFWINIAFTNHTSVLIQMKRNGAYFGMVYGSLWSRTRTGATSGLNAVLLKRGDVVTFSASTPVTVIEGLSWLGGALINESS